MANEVTIYGGDILVEDSTFFNTRFHVIAMGRGWGAQDRPEELSGLQSAYYSCVRNDSHEYVPIAVNLPPKEFREAFNKWTDANPFVQK